MTAGYSGPARLVLVGSVVVDLVLPVPALPPRGGDVLSAGATFGVGGGWYVLSAAAAAGLPTAYAGRHGRGPFGDRVRAALAAVGVEVMLAPDAVKDTGLCVVLVEPDGERTFITQPGAEARLDTSTLAGLTVADEDVVYVSGYDLAYPVSGSAIGGWVASRPSGAPLILDPGPLVADIPAELLAGVLGRTTLLTMNRREAALLTSWEDPPKVARAVRGRLAPAALVVLRDGARGAHVAGGELGHRLVHVAAVQVPAVDTTGAGDVHTGALVAGLVAGLEPVRAVQRANAAAAEQVSGRRAYRTVTRAP